MPRPSPPLLPVPRWVIADTHLGHANILAYCPWRQTWARSIAEHDVQVIAAWSRQVSPADWVLHLGDVALGGAETLAAYRRQLTGRICLVRGNHDRTRTAMLTAGFDLVVSSGIIADGGRRWLCRHDPATVSTAEMLGMAGLLHGHCHGQTPATAREPHLAGRMRDCGIDALRSIAPLAWAEVITGGGTPS